MSGLFSPGCLRITPRVSELIIEVFEIPSYLNRHLCGDWGSINEAERARNIESLENNTGHVLSIHQVTPEITIWITTKAGQTVIMLPMK
ncbi:hypothetical protein ACNHIR_10280 [Klebsiella michiganensis]|uniref:hypothetical protein n=1 Tax=Klebsiella michiganensis TaxID=1134687 RepID=UPI001071C580|nr:hypothetical protein [Klebsiella michiganensis]MBA8306131.1 hypothetical protein [Klebsiella michiganensis]QLP35695.1 hypothetical protein HVX57_09470 [Klebsiella michiganensis]WFX49334.1 hypothetical protein NFK05_09480 [Klebsiella michiganensis]WFX54994.1 hypothetical protein NFK06_09475 [Klebsiella michiganensis]